jgi:hypothetical protein
MRYIFMISVAAILFTACTLQKPTDTIVNTDKKPDLTIQEEVKPVEIPTTTPEKTTNTTTKPQIDKKETTTPKTDTKDTATTDEMTKELDALIDEIVSGK